MCSRSSTSREDPQQRVAYEEALQDSKRFGFNIVEQDPNQPRLIEHTNTPDDIEWGRRLHEQLKPRLWVQPSVECTQDRLRFIRAQAPVLTEELFTTW